MRLRSMLSVICGLLGSCGRAPTSAPVSLKTDYEQMIPLDSEDLAEEGIKQAYLELTPTLKGFGIEPEVIEEIADHDTPAYSIRHRGVVYPIYGPALGESEGQSWGRATYVFFHIVNLQLQNTAKKFYAFYGGNDLGGMFMTDSEYATAKSELPKKTDWPYVPTLEPEWYGQPH